MVQKGNPHQLPIRQHIFPAKSIARFCDKSGGVEVCFKTRGLQRKLRPNNAPFVVKQYWDAKAEESFKGIEDSFQAMIERINPNGFVKLYALENEVSLRMYSSWYARAHFDKPTDQLINGVIGPSRDLSIDVRERLEKAGLLTLSSDCIVSGRQLSWNYLLQYMDVLEEKFKGKTWGLLTAACGEFLVPDMPPNNMITLPVTPRHLLLMDHPNQTIPEFAVKEINNRFIAGSKNYYFARTLITCPT